ncbi:hypothetical protein [Roseateles violae]|uniref:Uncharacterized protein n=1 Tax=Roseateles violae TaxID=3058042 RepID=A0ABT8DVA7_9BURK|nr:hypothetical protein [Pelomonas sp. PFR6]MDN3922011.1 hypothetical protein [Pelomonas sp. PFR6]
MNKSHLLLAATLGMAALTVAGPAAAYTDVGVSVSIGQPGFYGRIDLGNAPPPQLIYTQPVIIERVAVQPAPVYLRVPVGYERNWARYCGQYGACGRPVYFVRDDWYRNTYAPHYREHYYAGGWHEQRRDRDHDGIPDYRDRDHGHGNGNGNGNGHGHGHGKRGEGHGRD